MSGGAWDYRQREIANDIAPSLDKAQELVMFAYECLNDVDKVLCGDTGEQTVKDRMYARAVELGNKLYGEEQG